MTGSPLPGGRAGRVTVLAHEDPGGPARIGAVADAPAAQAPASPAVPAAGRHLDGDRGTSASGWTAGALTIARVIRPAGHAARRVGRLIADPGRLTVRAAGTGRDGTAAPDARTNRDARSAPDARPGGSARTRARSGPAAVPGPSEARPGPPGAGRHPAPGSGPTAGRRTNAEA